MKNRNVVLFVVLGWFLLVGNAFANFLNCPLPQVRTTLYPFDGNHPIPTGLVQDTHYNFCGADPLRGSNRCGSVLLAYRQQEVDPTWFNPWAPDKAVAHASHPPVAAHKNRRKTGSAARVQRKPPVRQVSQASRGETKLVKR